MALAGAARPVVPASYPLFAANLDSDPARERILLLKGEGLAVGIEDPRSRGRSCTERVTPGFEGREPRLRVVEATGRAPREVLYRGDWGDNRFGELGLIYVAGRNERPGKCLHISRPFRYVAWRTCPRSCGWSAGLAPPPGYVVGSFRVQLRDLERRFPGREIRLVEPYFRPERKLEGADRRRTTLFRCCSRGRYVPYATRVERVS